MFTRWNGSDTSPACRIGDEHGIVPGGIVVISGKRIHVVFEENIEFRVRNIVVACLNAYFGGNRDGVTFFDGVTGADVQSQCG